MREGGDTKDDRYPIPLFENGDSHAFPSFFFLKYTSRIIGDRYDFLSSNDGIGVRAYDVASLHNTMSSG